eukprot:COSAG06_NODE_3228_length_5648_cov_3.075329_6_plen_244_part_00
MATPKRPAAPQGLHELEEPEEIEELELVERHQKRRDTTSVCSPQPPPPAGRARSAHLDVNVHPQEVPPRSQLEEHRVIASHSERMPHALHQQPAPPLDSRPDQMPARFRRSDPVAGTTATDGPVGPPVSKMAMAGRSCSSPARLVESTSMEETSSTRELTSIVPAPSSSPRAVLHRRRLASFSSTHLAAPRRETAAHRWHVRWLRFIEEKVCGISIRTLLRILAGMFMPIVQTILAWLVTINW